MKILLLSVCASLFFSPILASEGKVRALYKSLAPQAVSEQLAFYSLYPETKEGKQALKNAWKLLGGEKEPRELAFLPSASIETLVGLVGKCANDSTDILSDEQLAAIDILASGLRNRTLKGFRARTEREVIDLPPEQIDLARALLLSQMGCEDSAEEKIRSYEAIIDLLALQIRARLPKRAAAANVIKEMNHFIFFEMGYRFPPHSLYAKDIDVYTFLPSVIDSRQGVCLGVSILYLSLAQRLGLPLEVITPPGHIYVRYQGRDEVINIETTARGVHVDSEMYLSVDTRSLEVRNIKEVVGMAHMNLASLCWRQKEYQKALASSRKAEIYMPNDMLLKELIGYLCLFTGDFSNGKKCLHDTCGYIPDYAVSGNTVGEDYLFGRVDIEGMQALYMPVDETRESVLLKRDALEKTLEKYPAFRQGWSALGVTHLQLHRQKEAVSAFETSWALYPYDPTVAYYLAVLSKERLDYNNAWKYLQSAETITEKRGHKPKTLREFRKELAFLCPE